MKVNDAVYTPLKSEAPIVVQQGGTSCFAPDTQVVTKYGPKPISTLKPGELVKCYNEASQKDEWKPITKVHSFENQKRTVRVKLRNGKTITATGDHEFFYKGGWHSLKHLLSLVEPIIKDELNGKVEENTNV
jgi:hypothetical protein